LTLTVISDARVRAWRYRNREVRLEHLLSGVLGLVEVQRLLDLQGVLAADTEAVTDQLLADLPRRADEEPDTEPTFDSALDPLVVRAQKGGVLRTSPFFEVFAEAMPRELGFVRRPLAAAAAQLGATYDGATSAKGQELTFENWDPELRKCMVIMQSLSDKHRNWLQTPQALLVAVLLYKPYFHVFKGRGQDPNVLMNDMVASWPKQDPVLMRHRPSGTPTVSAPLFALVVRAERYAAEDATEVRLRHLLLALHDEPLLARWIDRLAG